MTRGVFIAFLIVWGAAAAAQTLQVRSGDHDGFTRLVIDIARGTQWTLGPGTDTYDSVIQFPENRFSFDTAEVFSRISKDRLADIGAVAGTSDLGLKLSCACGVEAFVLNGTMLVVDISENIPTDTQPTKPRSRAAFDFPSAGLPSLADTLAPPVETYGALPLDRLDTWSGGSWQGTETEGASPADPQPADIAKLERNITEQLARAVTRGLLDVSAQPAQLDPDPQTKGPAFENVPDGSVHTDHAGVPPNALHATLDDGRILLSGDNCIAEADLALRDWANDAAFDVQLRDLNQGLVGEFDRMDGQIAEKLAKFYLHYGMGPEAKVFLDLADTPAMPTLAALAALLDGKPDPTETFTGQTHCDGSAALWSLLTLSDEDTAREINTKAILRGFEALPDPLKSYLSSRLVDKLLALGEKATAQDLLKRVGRSQTEPNPETELARARMDIDDGHLETAATRLTDVARSTSGATSAHAVEALMQISAEHGTPAQTDISDLASAYSVEFRGTEEGAGLWRAHMRALIGNGEFDQVFEEMNNESSGDAQMDLDMRAEAADALIEKAEDLTFMRLALAASPLHPLGTARLTLLAAAERMLSLGLPDAASQFLEDVGTDRADRDARLLQARILLAQDLPEDAEIALIGLQGPEVLELRAEARLMMGDSDYAGKALDEVGNTGDSANSTWTSGEWTPVAESADGTLSDAVQPTQSNPAPDESARSASLGSSQALVGDSEATRESLRALLDATRIAPDG